LAFFFWLPVLFLQPASRYKDVGLKRAVHENDEEGLAVKQPNFCLCNSHPVSLWS